MKFSRRIALFVALAVFVCVAALFAIVSYSNQDLTRTSALQTAAIVSGHSKEKSKSKTVSLEKLPDEIRGIVDPNINYASRHLALRNLPANSTSNFKYLADYLKRPNSEDNTPFGQAFKNEIMDKLCESNATKVQDTLADIFKDKSQDVVLRDYALQHLIEIAERQSKSGNIQQNAFEITSNLLWQAISETDSSIAGTALLGLSHLSDASSEFDREQIAKTAEQLTEDNSTGQFARIAAIQVCARMNVTNSLPTIRNIALAGITPPLTISAIGALGLMGDTNSVPFLTELMNSSEDYLKPAARAALQRIEISSKSLARSN